MFRDINQQQEYAIYVLNERLSNVETEEKSKSSKEHVDKKSDEDTLVPDDIMETNTEDIITNIPKQNSTDDLKNQIHFTVDVQTKVEETIKNVSDKSSVEAKNVLKDFQDYINQSVMGPKVEAAFKGKNDKGLKKLVDKLNKECSRILTKSFKTSTFTKH